MRDPQRKTYSMDLKLSEILKITGGRMLQGKKRTKVFDIEISGISTDSRTLKKGELFVALRGKIFDGGNFILDAFNKGAIGAIVPFQSSCPLPFTADKFIIQVPETLKALGDIAGYYRRKFKIPLIAVTGGCGKTTTKEIVSSILSSRFKVLSSPSSYNNFIGLPLTLFKLTPEEEVAVVEMGMSHPGEIRRLREIASPQGAIITNIGKSHMEFFDSLQEIAKAEAELLEAYPDMKFLVLNRDDKFFPYFSSKTTAKIITFGVNSKSDFRIEKIAFDSLGRATFYLNGEKKIKLPFPGRGNIYNTVASLAIASSMGIEIDEAILRLEDVKLLPGRLNLKKNNGFYILDDTYNANPSSFMNLLEAMNKIKVEGKKVLIFGDMLELGNGEDREHKNIGKLISTSSIDVLISVGERARLVFESFSKKIERWWFEDISSAKKKLKDFLEKDNLLAFKGSRMMRMERLLPKIN